MLANQNKQQQKTAKQSAYQTLNQASRDQNLITEKQNEDIYSTVNAQIFQVQEQNLINNFQSKFGGSFRGVQDNRRQGYGNESPLIINEHHQPSVQTILNQSSLGPSEFIVKKPFISKRTQSNSSMISEHDNLTDSSQTKTLSPLKFAYSGERFKQTEFVSLQHSSEHDMTANYPAANSQVRGRDKSVSINRSNIAVKINKKRFADQANRTDRAFMPQPMVFGQQFQSIDPSQKLSMADAEAIKERMATTQFTLATLPTSKNIGEGSDKVTEPMVRNAQSFHQNGPKQFGSSVASSMHIDQIRYQNLSKLSNNYKQPKIRNNMSLPRESEFNGRFDQSIEEINLSATSQQRPKIMTLNSSGAPIVSFKTLDSKAEKNKMAKSGITNKLSEPYEQHKSVSPKAMQTSAEFKCRYKELTWNQKPPGMVGLQVDISQQFKANPKSKAKLSKRLALEAAAVTRNNRNLDANNKQFNTSQSNGQQTLRSPKPDPYFKKTARGPDGKIQLPSIGNSGKARQIRIAHSLPKKKHSHFVGQHSQQSMIKKKDSVVSGIHKLLERDGMSQDLPESPSNIAIMRGLIETTQASSKDYNKTSGTASKRHYSQPSSLLRIAPPASKGSLPAKLQEISHQVSTAETRPSVFRNDTNSVLSREELDERTFEIALGGRTDASIFFDKNHAKEVEHQAFEKLYGARQGRKFRQGTSVEMTFARTMEQQRQYLHPKLKDMIKKQYSNQVSQSKRSSIAILQKQNQLASGKRQSWVPSRHHSQMPSEMPSKEDLLANCMALNDTPQQLSLALPPQTQQPQKNKVIMNPILIERSEDKFNFTGGQQATNFDTAESSVREKKQSSMMNLPNSSQHQLPQDQQAPETANTSMLLQNLHDIESTREYEDSNEDQQTSDENIRVDFVNENLITEDQQTSQLEYLPTVTTSRHHTDASEMRKASQKDDEQQAFRKFKALGGSFLNQPERQIITMDNNGGLHYEQKNDLNNTMTTQQLRSPRTSHMMMADERQGLLLGDGGEDKWDIYKEDVLKVVYKGILSNQPKPKKVIRPPTPEPEINHLLHLEVTTIKQLLDNFTDEEREIFNQELITFSLSEEPTRYLVDKIDYLNQFQKDPFSVHLSQVYKMLFKKQTEIANDKSRLKRFKPESMQEHNERFIKKVYLSFINQLRTEISQRKIQSLAREGMDADKAELEAEKLTSVTRMKEMKMTVERRAAKNKDKRIVEYIKYLIGQTTNNEFTIQREEFKQTNDLHTKSLALSFDEYAAKEDDAMKKVANDILEKVEMNVVIQENTMPIAALKYADDPKFKYFMKIKEQMSLALPLLSKVVNKQLSLHNYKMGTAHCVAFAETCKFNYDFMSRLVLNNNGLSDSDLAKLLEGLQHMRTISVIDLRKNIVGDQSVRMMSDFMIRSNPRHLQVLRLVDCKMSHPTTLTLLKLMRQASSLRALSLVHASFDERNEKELVEYLGETTSLKELDLSWNSMSQQAYIEILKCVVENSNMLTLNLSHNVLIHDPKGFDTEEARAIKQDKMAKFALRMSLDDKYNTEMRQGHGIQRSGSKFSNRNSARSSRKNINMQIGTIEVDQASSDRVSSFQNRQNSKKKSANRSPQSNFKMGNLLQIEVDRPSSTKSYRSEMSGSYKLEINEKKATRVLNADKHVTESSQLNQLITLLLTQVMKKNRKLQHLDLTSTNLPSQVIVHLCNRLRKSRSICSVHFTDNPGLQEPTLEPTITEVMKCKPRDQQKIKINITQQVDFAFNSNMMQRLQQQLENEKIPEGEQMIARNTIRVRQIMQQKRIEQKAIDFPTDPETKKLVISRIIGFKEQMPGSGQWQLLSDRQDQCWHCDQWIYSLVFWDAETIGKKAKKHVHPKVLNQMVKKVEALNPDPFKDSEVSLSIYDNDDLSSHSNSSMDSCEPPTKSPGIKSKKWNGKRQGSQDSIIDLTMAANNDEPPMLYGDFTNWKGVPMMKLEDFVLMLAKKYGRQNQEMHEDFQVVLTEMKKSLSKVRRQSKFISSTYLDTQQFTVQSPSEAVRCYADLTDTQQEYYDKVLENRQKRILHDWKGVIEQYLEYRKPFLVDAFQLKSYKYKSRCPNLYVLPTFMPAGKHTYLVKNMNNYEFTMHTTLADFRSEDPPVLIKELISKHVDRVFRKDNSVFDPWKEDTDLTLQISCESDLAHCKLNKVVKDPFQLTKIYDYIFEKFADLKLFFMYNACHSHYPTVATQQLEVLCDTFKLSDNQHLKLSAIHICVAAAYTKPQKGQTKVGLNRAEFIEWLLRIAVLKYVNSKQMNSSLQAFQRLIEEDILANWTITPSWQDFRSRYLWTLDVNDVIAANLFGLQKLYNRDQTIHKTWMEYSEATYLFTMETNLLPEFQFKICYGFSKMTVSDEHTNASQHFHLQFVEFLELIGRVATSYWDLNKEHLQEISLNKKIEYILDILLALVNVKRNEVNIQVESDSCTDEDY